MSTLRKKKWIIPTTLHKRTPKQPWNKDLGLTLGKRYKRCQPLTLWVSPWPTTQQETGPTLDSFRHNNRTCFTTPHGYLPFRMSPTIGGECKEDTGIHETEPPRYKDCMRSQEQCSQIQIRHAQEEKKVMDQRKNLRERVIGKLMSIMDWIIF